VGIAGAQEQRKKFTLAALDLEAIGVSQVEARGLSDKLRSQISQLIQSGGNLKENYDLIEQAQLEKILDQFEIQATGCTSDSCAVEFGKLLQAERILIGSVSLVGQTYSVIARIVDVESGRTIGSVDRSVRGSIDDVMTVVMPQVGNSLLLAPQKKSNMKWYLIGAAVVAGGAAAALGGGGGGGGGTTPAVLLPTPPSRP
jgi:hypothetical protein